MKKNTYKKMIALGLSAVIFATSAMPAPHVTADTVNEIESSGINETEKDYIVMTKTENQAEGFRER